MSLFIHGRRWYFRLVPKDGGKSLMDDHTQDEINKSLIICYSAGTLPNGSKSFNKKGNPRKLYSLFDDYIDLYKYMEQFLPHQRCFFEMIPGEKPQKPKFDVDAKGKDEKEVDGLIDCLLTSIVASLKEMGRDVVPSRDIAIYTSHGKTTRSYHIVVYGYYCDNVWESFAFYQKVVTKISHPLVECVDRAVYSSRQQFRVLGSEKYDSGRTKTLVDTFSIDGDVYTHHIPKGQPPHLHHLRTSLIQFISDSERLPSLKIETKVRRERKEICEDDLDRMINLFFDNFEDADAFAVRCTLPTSVVLDRIRPSHCPTCSKIHETENPFLFLEDSVVYFSCRRTFERTYVGVIGSNDEPDVELVYGPDAGVTITEMMTTKKEVVVLTTDQILELLNQPLPKHTSKTPKKKKMSVNELLDLL
jgi:hypothetical protein